jgi:hypothetical protein
MGQPRQIVSADLERALLIARADAARYGVKQPQVIEPVNAYARHTHRSA